MMTLHLKKLAQLIYNYMCIGATCDCAAHQHDVLQIMNNPAKNKVQDLQGYFCKILAWKMSLFLQVLQDLAQDFSQAGK